MPEIKTEFLFKITLEVPPLLDLGETCYGRRRIARIAGGSFEGPKLKGEVLPGGGDWLLLRRDGVLVIDRLNRGEAVDPSLYYFRVTPYFETGAESYEWINKICSVATGARTASGPTYHVFQVL